MAYNPFPNAEAYKQFQAQAAFRQPHAQAWGYYSPQAYQQQHMPPALRAPPNPSALTPREMTPHDPKTLPVAETRGAKKSTATFKGQFVKELKDIMYGLGDEAPAQDTVALMEDILIEFLQETIYAAGQGSARNIQTEDLRRALQGPGDEKKLARLEELILLQVEIKKARAINGLEAGGKNLAE